MSYSKILILLCAVVAIQSFNMELKFLEKVSDGPNPDPLPNIELALGFINGTQLFKDCTPCDYKDEKIYDDIVDIIDILKGPVPETIDDFLDIAIKLLTSIQDIENEAENLEEPCIESYEQRLDIMNRLGIYMNGTDYQTKVVTHAAFYTFKIKKMLDDFQSQYYNRTHYENGVMGGQITRFVLFWDFK